MATGSTTLIYDTLTHPMEVSWVFLCTKGHCWVLGCRNELGRPSPSSLTVYSLQSHFCLHYAFCDSKYLDHF